MRAVADEVKESGCKQWPLERVGVTLEHQKIHARDCAECETRSSRIDRIERLVQIVGDLDETQRKRLLEIADKRSVHRTLQSEVQVVTREASDDE